MTNFIGGGIYVFFVIIVLIILITSLKQKKLGDLKTYFVALSISLLLWLVCEACYFILEDQSLILFFFDAKIAFVAFVALSSLLLILKFYKLEKIITPQFVFAVSIIPIATTLLAFTSSQHTLIRQELYITQMEPIITVHNIRGVWFWIHSVYCYTFTIATMIIIIVQNKKIQKAFRTPSTLILIGTVVSIVLSLISVISKSIIDYSMIGSSICLAFIYTAIIGNSTFDILTIARNDLFNYLDEVVVILDLHHKIIDYNNAAISWFEMIDLDSDRKKDINLIDIRDSLITMGAQIVADTEYENSYDIHFYNEDRYLFYNMEIKAIKNIDEEVGYFVYINDITRYKLMIERLELKVGIDSLTSVYNRNHYESEKREIDIPKNYPIGIIIGDVNNLKRINDQLGHFYGDEVLKEIALGLKAFCPENGMLARIGGDEFTMLLKNTSEESVLKIIKDVKEYFSKSKSVLYKPSISLGYAVKYSEEEDFEMLIYQADIRMYTEKSNDRRKVK